MGCHSAAPHPQGVPSPTGLHLPVSPHREPAPQGVPDPRGTPDCGRPAFSPMMIAPSSTRWQEVAHVTMGLSPPEPSVLGTPTSTAWDPWAGGPSGLGS